MTKGRLRLYLHAARIDHFSFTHEKVNKGFNLPLVVKTVLVHNTWSDDCKTSNISGMQHGVNLFLL